MLRAADLTIRLNPADDVVIAPGEHVHVHNVAGGANLICFTIGRGEDEFAPWVLGATM
ncbi:MAG: hypothetical protein IT513_04300 [Burkholderiales bacterium]|nr:hypothetical protein [Burkholderiales bacterium]